LSLSQVDGCLSCQCGISLEMLLPHLAGVVAEAGELEDGRLRIWAHSGTDGANCRRCGRLSERVHSRYLRRLADAPVGGHPVTLWLGVRRFFCGNAGCKAVTFAEQFEGLTSPRARRTPPLARMLGDRLFNPGQQVLAIRRVRACGGSTGLALDHCPIGCSLLYHMGEFVRQKSCPGLGVGRILPGSEDHITPEGVCERADASCGRARAPVAVNTHITKRRTETLLEEGTSRWGERLAWAKSGPYRAQIGGARRSASVMLALNNATRCALGAGVIRRASSACGARACDLLADPIRLPLSGIARVRNCPFSLHATHAQKRPQGLVVHRPTELSCGAAHRDRSAVLRCLRQRKIALRRLH
jgi:zinc-finger of transposase IS204/IS1001/IS1096/IS1165